MELNDIKKLIKKGIAGSAEKQLEIFLKDQKNKEHFKNAIAKSKKEK